jgi:hypothetical protein
MTRRVIVILGFLLLLLGTIAVLGARSMVVPISPCPGVSLICQAGPPPVLSSFRLPAGRLDSVWWPSSEFPVYEARGHWRGADRIVELPATLGAGVTGITTATAWHIDPGAPAGPGLAYDISREPGGCKLRLTLPRSSSPFTYRALRSDTGREMLLFYDPSGAEEHEASVVILDCGPHP